MIPAGTSVSAVSFGSVTSTFSNASRRTSCRTSGGYSSSTWSGTISSLSPGGGGTRSAPVLSSPQAWQRSTSASGSLDPSSHHAEPSLRVARSRRGISQGPGKVAICLVRTTAALARSQVAGSSACGVARQTGDQFEHFGPLPRPCSQRRAADVPRRLASFPRTSQPTWQERTLLAD